MKDIKHALGEVSVLTEPHIPDREESEDEGEEEA